MAREARGADVGSARAEHLVSRSAPRRAVRSSARVWIAAALCAAPSFASLTNDPARPPDRPRVGLVLSGGGARGAAHLGVLEVLEEAHIPVDFVVGTSMGAIIGGLYAAGSSPQEIRATIEKVDWNYLFDDSPTREYLTWRRREESRSFLVALELGWKDGGLRVPRGVVQGLKIEPLFRKLTLRVHDAPDFDALPLPFRAVAMDLATGERVVMKDGDLAEAMRASMSIAGAFAPVERDGRELVDGGYVDNLPVELAIEMGADIVIAVDVGTPPETDVQSIASLLSVAMQVQDVVVQPSRQRARAALRPQDVLVEPELGSISVADFAKMVEAAQAGRDAARSRDDALRALAVSDEDWSEFLARQRSPDRPLEPISRVRLVNHSSLSDAVILARMEGLGLTELDPEVVDQDLALLAGFSIFDRVDFRTSAEGDGTTDLVYSVREKSWGPNYLRFGFGLYDDFQGNGRYSLGIGWTTVPFAESGIEWRTDFKIGTPLRVDSELWVPLDPGLRWFVAPSGFFQERGYDLDDDPDIRGDVQTEQWAFGADAGRVFGDWGELRVGLRSGHDSNSLHESEGGTSIQDVDIGAWIARFSWDTLDLADFPTEGTFGTIDSFANVDALGASETFESIELRGSAFTSFGATTVGVSVDAGTSFGDALPVSRSFFLGGFTRLSGTAPDSRSGDTLLLARVMAWQSLSAQRTVLGFPLFVGGTLELGSTWTDAESVDLGDLTPAGSVFVASDTPLGPAALVLGVSDGDGVGLALVFGRLY